jgi:sulfate/thiosulfate transport system permease protein
MAGPLRTMETRSVKGRGGHHLEPGYIRWICIAVSLVFVIIFLVFPVIVIFEQAFSKGWAGYFTALADPDTLSAIRLTVIAASTSVLLNTIFGVAAAYAITRFRFPGKNFLISLIDLPFMISPVVSGLLFVLLFGAQGWFGPLLRGLDLKIIFATPGIILATAFVTFPFVARELIPVMQTLGNESEEAALVLGAGAWRMFFRITLPSIKWGLLYGIVLCSARAMGEFGAVSVVSGHIRGATNTIPLHVEILYNEYNFSGAFSVASLLMIIAFVSLVLKLVIEGKAGSQG